MTAPRNPGNEVFDREYMSALFEFGYHQALEQKAWRLVDLENLSAPD